MNINDLTIGQAKELAAMFGGTPATQAAPPSKAIGKKCVIRTYASGVHFGTVMAHIGREVELSNARRAWRWDVAQHGVSLSELAIHGPVGSSSKICEHLSEFFILDALEIIPCTDVAIKVFEGAKVHKP